LVRIGLIQQGGRDWIAGSIVLQNLVRALAMLPAREQPSVHLLLGPRQQVDALKSLGPLLPAVRRYTFQAGGSLIQKIRSSVRHAPFSHWPTSLDRLAERLDLSVLYPFQISPGALFPRPWLGWIPDFQHKRRPEYFSEGERARRDHTFQKVVLEATGIVVSSRDAYGDLMRWFPTDPGRVGVLPFVSVAADEWFGPTPEEVVSRLGLPAKYLRFPSQFWIHKNHPCLFEAVGLLKASSCPDIALVCTGHMNDYRHPLYADGLLVDLKRKGLDTCVHCLGLLDRTAQIQLMRCAAAIVQPSLFEGWSALLEDAQLLGKRVYVSDIPVHREQNPPDAHFFDPASPEDLADLIEKDWSRLSPGPDLAKESLARAAQEPRALAYAQAISGDRGRIGRHVLTVTRTRHGLAYLHVWREGHEYFAQKSGKFLAEWTNVMLVAVPTAPIANVRYVDLSTEPLDCPDRTFDAANVYHVLEHLTPEEGERFVRELFRVLKPGAVCRLSVPDLENICRSYLRQLEVASEAPTPRNVHGYRWQVMEIFEQMVRERSGGLMYEALVKGEYDPEYMAATYSDVYGPLLRKNRTAVGSRPFLVPAPCGSVSGA
jgi:predicted SAM-dependent methyltransferase